MRPPARSRRGSPSSGATALVDALSLLSAGFAKPEPQDAAGATAAPKIDRDSARIDWRREAALGRPAGASLRSRAGRVGHP